MVDEEVKIGVFICHCGTNIGGILDVPNITEYAKTLQDGKGGFRDSIANNMLEGYSPRGKAIRITKEILAKIYGGRMGSKSYNEKYENITELFEKVEEIEKDFNS